VAAEEDQTIVVARRPKAEWVLRLPSGDAVPVDRPLLIGRNPSASAGDPDARLVRIDDPGRTVSRTHVLVVPEPGAGILLRDVSSANGIVLVSPDGRESEIASGGKLRIESPCAMVLGTVEIVIESTAEGPASIGSGASRG